MRWFQAVGLVAAWCGLAATWAAEPVRVALLDFGRDEQPGCEETALKDFSRAVQAKLLADPDYSWMERQDLERLAQEAGLQGAGASNPADSLRLGKWARADLLLRGDVMTADGKAELIAAGAQVNPPPPEPLGGLESRYPAIVRQQAAPAAPYKKPPKGKDWRSPSGVAVTPDVLAPRLPLHMAARQGQLEVVRLLLAKGAAVNARDACGRTALQWAARHGHTAVGRALLAAGQDPQWRTEDNHDALSWAARYGKSEAVKLLLPLSAHEGRALAVAEESNHPEIAALLRAAGYQP